MKNKFTLWIALAVVVAILIAVTITIVRKNGAEGTLVPITPTRGDLALTIATIGTVKPQNRLEIKPPINGRVEQILVTEGEEVKVGQILALMSSTERATLIDAARLRGKEEFAYWQRAYKETPLIAPIDGVVIVRNVEPGQTVTTSNAVLVLSDRLIVEADVDETDIGQMHMGQKAIIGLDAYPQIQIDGVVDHISYESELVSNVTIYKVDVLPKKIPEVFRSGMSANIEVIVKELRDALLLPTQAIQHEGGASFVLMQDPATGTMKKQEITIGLESDGEAQILSGIKPDDVIFTEKKSFILPRRKQEETPFLPNFHRKEERPKQ